MFLHFHLHLNAIEMIRNFFDQNWHFKYARSPYKLSQDLKQFEDNLEKNDEAENKKIKPRKEPKIEKVFYKRFFHLIIKFFAKFVPAHGQKLMIPLLGFGTKTSQELQVKEIRDKTPVGNYLSPRDALAVILYFLYFSIICFKAWLTENWNCRIKVVAAKDVHPTLNLPDHCKAFVFEGENDKKHMCLGAGYCNPNGCSYKNVGLEIPCEIPAESVILIFRNSFKNHLKRK